MQENPLKDRAAQVELVQAMQVFANAGGELPLPASAATNLVRARWLLEELRVSLFAQTLGTKDPVSLQRIKKALES
jgi:ATP-dependent helicase HrpA